MVGAYPVMTLCGSARFKDEFLAIQKKLTNYCTVPGESKWF